MSIKKIHSKANIFIISLICTLALLCPAEKRGIIIIFFIAVFLCILFLFFSKRLRPDDFTSLEKHVQTDCLSVASIIALILLYFFASRWISVPSGKITAITEALHVTKQAFVITVGFFLAVGSAFFSYSVLFCLLSYKDTYSSTGKIMRLSSIPDGPFVLEHIFKKEIITILLCAGVCITLCSRSSFLYPLNNWDDANCFFTVGKGMFNGMVPYRDLFEQKGPLLYFIYGLAYLVSHNTFHGAYFLEIVAAFFYLLYSYKITVLLLQKRLPALIPVIALLTYTSFAFEQGGSAEEFCLPLLSFSLWLALHDLRDNDVSRRSFICLGIVAGCVFWIKFTITGFYIGWAVWLLWYSVRKKEVKAFFKKIGYIFCGVILATVPWIIYFGHAHALRVWLEVYLYDNLFIYTEIGTRTDYHILHLLKDLGGDMYAGLYSFSHYNPVVLGICAFCLILFFIHRNGHLSGMLFLMMVHTFFFIYIGGRWFRYNSLVMNVFISPGLCLLLIAQPKAYRFPASKFILPFSTVLCMICAFFFTPNRYFMGISKAELAQYQFMEIIAEASEGDDDVTLLNYGFLDGGFYTVCDILPNCRAFCGLNIPLLEIREDQQYYVNHGLCDFIVTRFNEQIDFELYDCIAESISDYAWRTQTYRLYQLKT